MATFDLVEMMRGDWLSLRDSTVWIARRMPEARSARGALALQGWWANPVIAPILATRLDWNAILELLSEGRDDMDAARSRPTHLQADDEPPLTPAWARREPRRGRMMVVPEGIHCRQAAAMPPAFQRKPIEEGRNPLSPGKSHLFTLEKTPRQETMKSDAILQFNLINRDSQPLSRSG